MNQEDRDLLIRIDENVKHIKSEQIIIKNEQADLKKCVVDVPFLRRDVDRLDKILLTTTGSIIVGAGIMLWHFTKITIKQVFGL